MRRAALVLAGFIPLACAAASAVAHAQAVTAILAADLGTHIEPIAQFAARGWSALPRGRLGRLAPGQWTRWTAGSGSSSIRLSVREPIGTCAVAQRLPVAGAAVPAGRPEYAGIAAWGAVDIVPMRRVAVSSPDAARIADVAGGLFGAREREHGVTASTFAKATMTLDGAYEAASATARAYYFEASKRVFDAGNTPEEDPRGIVRLTVSGWLRDADNRLTPAGTKGELHWDSADEDVSAPSSLTPLGVVSNGAEQIWVMRESIGSRESLVLYALGATVRPLLRVAAAEC